MELLSLVVVLAILMAVIWLYLREPVKSIKGEAKKPSVYSYKRKENIMTDAEQSFYKRLVEVAGDRYYVFPQMHLSSLLTNDTKGRYWKAAFQRINRTSVDYVLAHKETLKAAYAVELDDSTHDTAKRQARDAGVEKILTDANIPLLRFRNPSGLSNDDIAERFYNIANK